MNPSITAAQHPPANEPTHPQIITMVSSSILSSHNTCKATCLILSQQSSAVLGVLELEQSGSDNTVKITGELSNLTPGLHGLAVCESGDLSDLAISCGKIFNPFGKTHGAPTDDNRMVGDLGNITVDAITGRASIDLSDNVIRLIGPHSIIGRSIVIYSGEDDMGRGGHENSLTTGNAGPRVAAGVIGLKRS
jgi:superoxide dismutase, Cu-Zn family